MKRPKTIRWSERALDDLDAALAYIARDNPEAARRLRDQVVEGLASAQAFPEVPRIVPELDDPHIREVLRGPLRVVFQIQGDELRVLAARRMERAPIVAGDLNEG